MRRRLITFAILLMLMGAAANADPGHDLFTGQNTTAAEGRIARFACHNCHGRDGRGGIEGNVPEIAGAALLEPTELRAAYDLTQFRSLLTTGVDPSGRDVSRIMPRYDLSGAELDALWEYVQDLPRQQALGIAPDHVRFGVVIDPANPTLGTRYLQAFKGELARALPAGAVYGRKIEAVALDDPVGQADTVIAALAMPPNQIELTRQITETGLPVIFGLTALEGHEDTSIRRSFVPTDRDVNGAITAHLATTDAQTIGISAPPERIDAISYMIHLSKPSALVGAVNDLLREETTLDVVIDLDGNTPRDLPAPGNLYRLASLAQAPARADRQFLVIQAPSLIALAIEEDLHPLEAHATLSARVLAKSLTEAGRDLSRARLLSALADARLGAHNLDYARLPLNGSDYVAIVEDVNAEY